MSLKHNSAVTCSNSSTPTELLRASAALKCRHSEARRALMPVTRALCFMAHMSFFEKMRIKQNKPKSEKRKEMEEVWGPGGFDIEHNSATTGLVLSPSLSRSFPCFQFSLPFVSYACLLSSYTSTTKDSLRNGRHCHKRQIRKDALLQAL